jgi:transcriptional regulator with XRE-family HTH domain
MDNRTEIRDFLASRRARITPDQAGPPAYGGHRRVPGLRREEVALLAGVSVDYYTQMERGNLHGVSDSVLDAMEEVPAHVRTSRLDILGVNRLGSALYAPVLAPQQLPVNLARFLSRSRRPRADL